MGFRGFRGDPELCDYIDVMAADLLLTFLSISFSSEFILMPDRMHYCAVDPPEEHPHTTPASVCRGSQSFLAVSFAGSW